MAKHWTIYHPELVKIDGGIKFGTEQGLEIYTESHRKLSIKHPLQFGFWQYVMSVILNELGVLTDATLSDQGIEERWQPVHNKYKSYKDYVNKMTNHYSKDLKEMEVKLYMDHCPEEMREF